MKQAVITGGSSGLGFAIAEILVDKGISVTLIGRHMDKLEAAKIALKNQVEIYPMNVSEELEVASFFHSHPHVDYLFNVAGKGIFGPLHEVTRSTIDQMFEANLIGLILMSKYFLTNKESGKLINVISTAGKVGKDNEAVYCASKFGARGFTEALQKTYKGTDIKVLGVYPGGMNTPFWQDEKTTFMEPSNVAEQIVTSVLSDDIYISELVIERP